MPSALLADLVQRPTTYKVVKVTDAVATPSPTTARPTPVTITLLPAPSIVGRTDHALLKLTDYFDTIFWDARTGKVPDAAMNILATTTLEKEDGRCLPPALTRSRPGSLTRSRPARSGSSSRSVTVA